MNRCLLVCVSLVSLALGTACAQKPEPVRVACIGDSITYGAGVQNREMNCYPAVLQAMLGDGYIVKNFGVNGATLLNAGDNPYTKQKAYKDALAFKPNIVVLKLGTNDTKPQNWKHADKFDADYAAIIKSFQDLSSKPKVILCTPVPAYPSNFGITDTIIKGEVKPKVEALANAQKLSMVDLYTALSDKAKLFPDKIHPNAEGAKLIAEAVKSAIPPK